MTGIGRPADKRASHALPRRIWEPLGRRNEHDVNYQLGHA
jgi:hypothetical protein